MKYLLTLLLLIPILAIAQVDLRFTPGSTEDVLAGLEDQKLELELELAEETTKIPALQKRNDDYYNSLGRWQEERIRLGTEKTAVVNAWSELRGRCNGTTSDPNFYNACKGEEAVLNGRQAQLVRDGEASNMQQESLKIIESLVVRDTTDFNYNYTAIQEDIADVEAQITAINDLGLDAIGKSTSACEEAILAFSMSSDPFNDSTAERMKAVCGSPFDGN